MLFLLLHCNQTCDSNVTSSFSGTLGLCVNVGFWPWAQSLYLRRKASMSTAVGSCQSRVVAVVVSIWIRLSDKMQTLSHKYTHVSLAVFSCCGRTWCWRGRGCPSYIQGCLPTSAREGGLTWGDPGNDQRLDIQDSSPEVFYYHPGFFFK